MDQWRKLFVINKTSDYDSLRKKNSTQYKKKLKIEKQQGLMTPPTRSMEDQGIRRHTAPTL